MAYSLFVYSYQTLALLCAEYTVPGDQGCLGKTPHGPQPPCGPQTRDPPLPPCFFSCKFLSSSPLFLVYCPTDCKKKKETITQCTWTVYIKNTLTQSVRSCQARSTESGGAAYDVITLTSGTSTLSDERMPRLCPLPPQYM